MTEEVRHYHITENSRYKVQFERSATKGVIGYKCEANGDDATQTFEEARDLMRQAETATPGVVEELKEVK